MGLGPSGTHPQHQTDDVDGGGCGTIRGADTHQVNHSTDELLFGAAPDGTHGDITIHLGDVLDAYPHWATPDVIVADGAYGVSGFPGDPATAAPLGEWYASHIKAWTAAAKPSTVLFFWCTEVGWATVHPHLIAAGWEYVQLVTWDKGIAHVAGNVNSKTIRHFPVVTEVCGIYTRPMAVSRNEGVTTQDWLRAEWARTGMPFRRANEACGVKDAATRKYLSTDAVWYAPPPAIFERLATYANIHGDPAGAPYFADVNGVVTGAAWEKLRYRWNHTHGLTNVWSVPALRGKERIKTINGKTVHLNQKPLELMRRCVGAVGEPGDVVWEPFGGTGSATAAAVELGRVAYVAEANELFMGALRARLGLHA